MRRYSAHQLGLRSEASVAELRTVSEELASDALFTTEHSVATTVAKRWCALRDHLSAVEMTTLRESMASLLRAITPDDAHWIWFVDQIRFSNDEAETTPDEYFYPENHYSLEARDELLSFDGRVGIFQLSRDEIGYWTRTLGHFDAARGILTRLSFSDVLSRLPLRDPVPSTERCRFSRRPGMMTLERLLDDSICFFEEIRNGTAIRFVASPEFMDTVETASTAR